MNKYIYIFFLTINSKSERVTQFKFCQFYILSFSEHLNVSHICLKTCDFCTYYICCFVGYYQGLKQAKNFQSVGGNCSRNSSGKK